MVPVFIEDGEKPSYGVEAIFINTNCDSAHLFQIN
jgi:hypothetical protein